MIHQITYTYYAEYADKEICDLYFNDAGLLTQKVVLDEKNGVLGRLIWHFDTTGVLLWTAGERLNGKEVDRDSAIYHYDDQNHLTEVIVKTGNNTLVWQGLVRCDSSGRIIENNLYDSRGTLQYTEKVEYLQPRKRMVIRNTKQDGSMPVTDTVELRGSGAAEFPQAGETYNVQGDLIRKENYTPFGGRAALMNEYGYDEYGNFTDLNTFRVKGIGRKERKRELQYYIQRKYTY